MFEIKTKYIIIIILIILILFFLWKKKEHYSNESILNIANIYTDTSGTVYLNNTSVDGKIDISGTKTIQNETSGFVNNVKFTKSIDVSKNIFGTRLEVSKNGSDGGGSINLVNPAKTTAGTGKQWTLYNMGNINNNGNPDALEFWKYDASGNIGNRHFVLNDNGNVSIPNGGLITTGNIKGKTINASYGSSDGIGASLNLTNPGKTTAGTGKTWTIYNMADLGKGYQNALEFWKYDASGNIGNRHMILNDNGNVNIPNGGLTANGYITGKNFGASYGSSDGIGASLNLINPGKTTAGTGKTWTLYNMGNINNGGYPNALEFWKYDGATGSGNRHMVLNDNGNVNIPNGGLTANDDINSKSLTVTSNNVDGIGGSINLINPAKTSTGKGKKWAIHNMSHDGSGNNYSDGLEFWNYDENGTGKKIVSFSDNGNVNFTGDIKVNKNISIGSNLDMCNWEGDLKLRDWENNYYNRCADFKMTCNNKKITKIDFGCYL